jgi:YVTN family beta-propeller protein
MKGEKNSGTWLIATRLVCSGIIALGIGCISLWAQPTAFGTSGQVKLSNGWFISPAGTSLPLGDLPLNIAVSPSKKYLAVTNNGQSVQSLQLIDAQQKKVLHSLVIPKSWYGLSFAQNDKQLYASGGYDNWILRYNIINQKLVLADTIVLGKRWPNKVGPAGLVLNEAANRLFVVTIEDSCLYTVDTKTKATLQKLKLPSEAYACLLSPNKKYLYVSAWGADKVLVIDVAANAIVQRIAVGDNPNEMVLSENGNYLFVCNANDNSVSVINTQTMQVMETLDAALFPNALPGSTTNGLALSANGKTLYIANADNNCLAVFDVSKPGQTAAQGFIPTGWYPTNVKVIGNNIWVANGKGFSSYPNPYGPQPNRRGDTVIYQQGGSTFKVAEQYIGGLMKGTMSIIPTPTTAQLAQYSKAVYSNIPAGLKPQNINAGLANSPFVGAASPVKHVFYIVKENRTYDQVLGDMPEGNGDTSLVLFGERVTPNQHKLAREFVLLDNFYVDGEVSADGHNWSLGAYANDYLEKTWPTAYGGRGGNYTAEGNREIANNKGGFIWDLCARNGVSYRTYGEFADDYKANLPILENHFCPYFTSWDERVRDTTRFYQWRREFDSLLAVGKLPQMNTLRFINDHTEGLSRNRPTPFAHVADNDWAVGLFVEHLSKSPIWKESVVFILEDDAQNGADHVDAHRSPAYIAGGYIKRGFVDHTMYSTTSMLRTMELLLGLPPMTQHDAAATPMWNCFAATPNLSPFNAVPANIDLGEKNTVMNKWQRLSEGFDFSREDAAPDLLFSQVLWHAIKGDGVPFPGPKRAAFFKGNE